MKESPQLIFLLISSTITVLVFSTLEFITPFFIFGLSIATTKQLYTNALYSESYSSYCKISTILLLVSSLLTIFTSFFRLLNAFNKHSTTWTHITSAAMFAGLILFYVSTNSAHRNEFLFKVSQNFDDDFIEYQLINSCYDYEACKIYIDRDINLLYIKLRTPIIVFGAAFMIVKTVYFSALFALVRILRYKRA